MIPLRDDNPVRNTPVVTIALIALNVIAFLWELGLPAEFVQTAVYSLGFVPAVAFGRAELPNPWLPAPLTVLTSMFLHGGWLHLAGNMLYLWIFGDNVEDRLGRVRFGAFYVGCGIVAALAQALPDTRSIVPMIGASGAISGVLGAYIVLYPRANVLVALPLLFIFYTFRVPAALVLGFWFLGQLVSTLGAGDETGVAFGAHLGGFVAGIVLVFALTRDRRRRTSR
jgi:membrane associated rhomboid family serine protease